jgi:CheY-like chemotaxis protein
MRIVLIDEEAVPMNYYVKALMKSGFEVVQFLDVEQALADVRARRPDLVILDMMMPPPDAYDEFDTEEGIMTGLFLFRDLRNLYPDLPIVVLTNLSDPSKLSQLSGDPLLVMQKNEATPFDFAAAVQRFMSSLVSSA